MLLSFGQPPAAQKLAARHKEWLEKDVRYVISKEEKALLQSLPTDKDRDLFMERFWEIRNPVPGSPLNRFKEEHYKRMAYASEHFGRESATDGWRTDRGRVYILLGPPQQRMFHNTHQKLRPFEVWFYSSPSPALPPFFYVVFYQKENIGDYRLYSPYMDGPQRLVNAHQAEQGRTQSLRVIQDVAGREVARISLSLLPDEPVDWDSGTSSLQSDIVLSALKDLANHPLHKGEIDRRRQILQDVSVRLVHEDQNALDVLTVPLRNGQGEISLHYVMRLKKPGSLAIRQDQERFDYRIQASVRVMDSAGKLLFTQEKEVTKVLSQTEVEGLREKVFGYQGSLPLPSGRYKIEFTLTSWNNNSAFRATRDVTVPDIPSQGMFVTPLLPFLSAERSGSANSDLPFVMGGLRFSPIVGQNWSTAAGGELSVLYQIWRPAQAPRTYGDAKLEVEYVFGRPAVQGDSTTVRDIVSKSQFDGEGSLLSGKKLRLDPTAGGNYLLTLSVSDPETRQKAFGRFSFRVGTGNLPPPTHDVYDEDYTQIINLGIPEYQRGLCLVAHGKGSGAKAWFQRALQRNPDLEEARAKLADAFYSGQEYGAAVALYEGRVMNSITDEKTILRIADSYEKLSQRTHSIEILTRAVAARPPSAALFRALSDLYRRASDERRAAEWLKKAAALESPPPS